MSVLKVLLGLLSAVTAPGAHFPGAPAADQSLASSLSSLKNCSSLPEPNNCACGDKGKHLQGACFACGSCGSCFNCHSCVKCFNDGVPPPPPLPPPPTPALPPAPAPASWLPRVAAGQLLVAQSEPEYSGLFPSVGNGFISGNVGCATALNTKLSGHGDRGPPEVGEFFIHVGGVFNNNVDVHGKTSIPQRAKIPNPFAMVAHIIGAAPNVQAGTALDIQRGMFHNVTATANNTEVRVSTTIYTHRALRSLLVFEVAAEFPQLTNSTATPEVAVGLKRCGGGDSIDWTKLSDFNASSTSSEFGVARTLVVKYMEENCDSGHFCPEQVPLQNCGGLRRCSNTAMPRRPNTEVGIAFEPVPSTLTLTANNPVRKFIAAIHTSLEPGLGAHSAAATAAAKTLAQYRDAKSTSASLRQSHEHAWAKEWTGGIEIAGNLTIASTVNASLYYILSATRPDWPYGLSPGGLARDSYEGHSFWDCETWMFPNLVALFPEQALALTEYRSARIQAARIRAATHGYNGAQWPWESALTGFGEFQFNDDNEIHISGDVANAFRLYYRMTKNETWLRSSGWPVIRDSADFFASRAVPCGSTTCTLGGVTGATTANLTYRAVVSPDESAGRHDSSAYTNGIAITVLDFALEAARLIGEAPGANWSSVSEKLYLPIVNVPDGFMAGTPIHTEFHGYDQKTHPHINQADVTLLQYPLGLRSNKRIFPPLPNSKHPDIQLAINDLLFWQPKSDNQVFYTGDSSNSIAWLEMGNRTAADAQFDLAFTHMDLKHFNVFEEKNTGDFGHLNFITGAGGYLQNIINGYLGLRYTSEGLNLRPVLPPHGVTSVKLRALSLASSRMDFVLTSDNVTITLMQGGPLTVASQGVSNVTLMPSQRTVVELCTSCGCGCPGGGCGCLSIFPSK